MEGLKIKPNKFMTPGGLVWTYSVWIKGKPFREFTEEQLEVFMAGIVKGFELGRWDNADK